MRSFVANGHSVHLHVYEAPAGFPDGVELLDAGKILPREHLFRHARSGSFAVFADWFRYQLLYRCGGIWADTDVVCLRPLNYAHPEIFAWQDEREINNAVLGLPAGHELALWMMGCCEHPNRFQPYDTMKMRRRKLKRRLFGGRRSAVHWGESGPSGFTNAARHLGYADRALPFWHFYPVNHLNWRTVFDSSFDGNFSYIAQSFAVHLWNEKARQTPGFDKNGTFPANSMFEHLCARYLTSGS